MNNLKTIAVCGAGTMGSGIAQVAAQSGYYTILFDLDQNAVHRGKDQIKKSLQFLVSKNKISAKEETDIINRITFTNDLSKCVADVIIEAIIEKLEIKMSLFNQLAAFNASQTIFASNTSSLSISEMQQGIIGPTRIAGLHFFNPAPVMKLVEVVKGEQTSDEVVQQLIALCKAFVKTPVVCKDSPGFIVNRVARHYYLEAMKLVEEGIATIEVVDDLMEASGFKMGPFKLMDLIGMDINYAVSESIYQAFDKTERFKPSPLQQAKVEAGDLGKKTGKGFYEYK